MNKHQARKHALTMLHDVCDDPDVYFDFESWLPGEQDYDTEHDQMLNAFFDLQVEFARRSGGTKRDGHSNTH